VFTVPHELNPLALKNPARFYDLLFAASSQALLEVAADPRRLSAQIGFFSILHTWSSNVLLHPHIHCVVPAGGLSSDHQLWIHTSHPRFLVPVPALRIAFRKKFIDGLEHLYSKGLLDSSGPASAFENPDLFAATMERLKKKRWVVVYAKPPFGGPEHVLRYLGRYTHRIAISNHRLLGFDGERVTFRWKDYAHGGKKRVMTLDANEFLRRFFLHVLPKGASCASATSDCSPIGSAKSACPWREDCSPPIVAIHFQSFHRRPPPSALHSGAVPTAADPCAWRKDSPPQSYP
jgi:Putative transposase